MVDVSERAWRRAARSRVGSFGPATADEVGTGEFGLPDPLDSLDGPDIGVPLFLPADADEWLTGPLPGVVGPDPDDECPTGPIPVIPADGAPTQQATATAAALRVAPPAPPAPFEAPSTSAPRRTPPVRSRPAHARTVVRATVLAVLFSLMTAGAAALAADKTITITVDGRDRTVHTFAGDVAGALASAGLTANPQDRVEPALPTELADGDHVMLAKARLLTIVEAGSERRVWTTAASVDEALRSMGVEAAPIQMSISPDAVIPLGGLAVELRVPRTAVLTDGTGAPSPVTTTAGTVAGLLAEQGIELGANDVSVPSGDTLLTDGAAVHVVRNGVGEVVEVRRTAPPEQVVEDPELPRGEREVVEPGKPGEQTAVMRVYVQNGREVRREQVRAGSTTPPQPRVVKVGTNDDAPAVPAVADGGVWDRLARCEATGNWSINTGNGYYGGLQFDRQTWAAYGGTQYAALPHQASREEQIAVATQVRDDRGSYGSWPGCARKLGLPR